MIGRGPIDIVHDQALLVSEARLSLDVGISRRFVASVMVPVRIVGSSIRYLDAAGDEVQLNSPDIHHRNETVTGIGDPMLLVAASGALAGWRVTARVGATLPIGRTEEDPFRLGDMGLRHQHIQLGTGTVNPVIAVEATRAWGPWRFGAFALSQQVVYENGKGYEAGDRYAGGVALRRGLGGRWSVRGSLDALGETAERWGGVVHTDDGNRGRFDLIAGAGASWSATERFGVDVALKIPAITHAVGGQLDMPAILEVGASWSFGGPGRAAPQEDEHGHDHAHGGHEHEHGEHGEHGEQHAHGDHGDHGDHGHDGHDGHDGEHARPDTTGLDVADLGAAEAAAALAPVPGKLTVFDFWATWCEPCKVLEPALVEIARAHPALVAIRRVDATDWDSPTVARHLAPKGFALPHLKIFDPSGRLVLERSSERGKLEELIRAVRALAEAEAARRTPAPAPAPAATPGS